MFARFLPPTLSSQEAETKTYLSVVQPRFQFYLGIPKISRCDNTSRENVSSGEAPPSFHPRHQSDRHLRIYDPRKVSEASILQPRGSLRANFERDRGRKMAGLTGEGVGGG